MRILLNSMQQVIFVEEVEYFLMQNSSDMLLVSLVYVSILIVLMTNGSLIYFILRQDLKISVSQDKMLKNISLTLWPIRKT